MMWISLEQLPGMEEGFKHEKIKLCTIGILYKNMAAVLIKFYTTKQKDTCSDADPWSISFQNRGKLHIFARKSTNKTSDMP